MLKLTAISDFLIGSQIRSQGENIATFRRSQYELNFEGKVARPMMILLGLLNKRIQYSAYEILSAFETLLCDNDRVQGIKLVCKWHDSEH